MKLSLKTNLRIGLGISLLLLIITSVASFVSIKNLIKSADMVVESNAIINDVDNIVSMLKDAETGQRGFLLTGNTVFLDPYERGIKRTDSLFAIVMEATKDNAFHQQKLNELKTIIGKRMEVLVSTIETKRQRGTVLEKTLLEGKVYMDDARRVIREIRLEEKRSLGEKTAEMNTLAGFSPILIVIAAVLSVLSTVFFYQKVSSEFNERVSLFQQLQHLNEDTAKRIDTIKSIAHQISSGNYKVRLHETSKDGLGSLSGSLNSMAESLQHSFTLLEDKEWMQTGVATLNDKMVGDKDVESLAKDVLIAVVEHTKSMVGAFYILEDDQHLHLLTGYALDFNESRKRIAIGEGLVGQAFQSEKLILLEKVPNNEVTISYATGQTKPTNVVAFPIVRNGLVLGVIELATVNAYPQRKIEFMTNVSTNIGIAVNAAQNRKKLQDFLEETQSQAEELQAQHSELEALNAELEAQTQKIQASEEELRVQQEELLQSNQELEERSSLLEERNQLISERNQEIKLKAEQLEQSTRYKSEFLANMSHELRTPLNSILLLSKLMSESEELQKEYTEYASVIQSSGQGLLSLIDEILDLSKIEAGKMELEIGNVRIDEVTADIRSLFMPIAKDKHLDLVIGVSGDAPASFTTDKMRLSQILKNLLSNAFKFTSQGKVSLSIGYNEKDDILSFAVADTGIGIPREKQGLVFEAFQQADGSTRRKFGGTGLGLSISKQLAKLLGGNIKLESKEGEGSTFTLTIPANYEDRKEVFFAETTTEVVEEQPQVIKEDERFVVSKIPADVEDDRNNITSEDKAILIIEDDTYFAKTLLDFTRKRSYKGLVAVRGDVGIEMAQKYNPLAILLDIQLPVKDGWQVMDELKSNALTRHIPVHIMSSLSAKRESLQKGAVDFINKPFALEHMKLIFEKLEYALSKNPKKVLIVEENKQHAQALSHYLGTANLQTIVASNINESIEALQRKEVDCVILDMGIPDKNAYETLETIKKSEGLENLPIIIFTGKNLSKGEETRIKQYADSIVVKTAHSYQRILDEAAVFLHLVEEKGNKGKQPSKLETLPNVADVLKDKVVLIADDDVRNIFSLTKALEPHKMKVLPATDGKEALAAIKANPNVDVVLMDMMMPELDGYETTKQIRAMAPYKNLPILAVTAKAMMGDREKCIAAGASDYISKPVDIDQLISLLRVWLYDKL
ncbi:MAG: response regulator [Pedobacter sp.]|uniref:response regulator n=1 Tax=Pedobacter sp. TaxID=1411316 RepID=UPI002806FD04|nr:response regulator [Pedobacter sp.]MDQ8005108.1 response regulator [Pedobacter sp.]